MFFINPFGSNGFNVYLDSIDSDDFPWTDDSSRMKNKLNQPFWVDLNTKTTVDRKRKHSPFNIRIDKGLVQENVTIIVNKRIVELQWINIDFVWLMGAILVLIFQKKNLVLLFIFIFFLFIYYLFFFTRTILSIHLVVIFAFDIRCCRSLTITVIVGGKSRKPLGGREKEAPFKLELGDLPQDLSVHRSHFSSALNHTPAHSGGTSSGNGLRNSSPLPVAAHLQSAYSTHRGLPGSTGRSPWPKDEIQVWLLWQ